jgi:hypothetical protein
VRRARPEAGAGVEPRQPGEHGVRREPTIRQEPPVPGRAQEEGAGCVAADAEPASSAARLPSACGRQA